MRRPAIATSALCLILIATPRFAGASDSKAPVDFKKQVAPIFAAHCIKCHGPRKQEGGLRLDHRATALRGGDSGKLLTPKNAAGSEIIKRITSKDESTRMPPPEKGNKALTKTQITLLKRWVDQGANWPKDGKRLVVKTDHWAYQPIKEYSPPKLTDATSKRWVRNSIDAFILAKLRKHKLQPSEPADRYTLIKRLYYDLIGLPPAPKDVDAFVSDKSPKAYEKLVDRLLASKHFGERWGRHWLDKARYADSDGYEKDRPRLNAWRYRDWVIDAINRDLPFDEFTRQQLAGDLLPNATAMQKLATAFHRQTLTNTEGGTDKEQFRVEATFDRVATTGTVWLGLTVGCAQCHTHKYDPITQAEYYQLFAFFNNGDESTIRIPYSSEAIAKYKVRKIAHDKRVANLESKLNTLRIRLAPRQAAWEKQMLAKLKTSSKNEIRFHPLKPHAMRAESKAKLIAQKDGSVLVTGQTLERDTYQVNLQVPVDGVRAFRIEALTDKRLPKKGPGRTPHGNFVLTNLRAEWHIQRSRSKEKAPLKFTKATHSFAQKNFPAKNALDPGARTGWAISPQMGKTHSATFYLARPANLKGKSFVRFILSQNYGGRHTLGKFRITAMTGTEPGLKLAKNVQQALQTPASKRSAKQKAAVLQQFALSDRAYKKLHDQLAAVKKSTPKQPMMNVRVITQRSSKPRKTHILRRGDFLQPQAEVQPDAPAVLHDLKARHDSIPPSQGGKQGGRQADRLDLANWLMSPQNRLTSRVAVNHIWSHLFGHGIVRTINDFGVRGEKPTHPKLLDWLAKEYQRKKWSRKAMIKLIVMSATYRQSSSHKAGGPRPAGSTRTRPSGFEDAENRLLSRQNRFRVEAEIVRDVYLEASGLLSKKIGGPSVFPPMPPDVAALSYANNFKWNTSKGPDRFRRGMYTFFKRTAPHPNLVTFDCPDSNTTNVKRRTSNTPLMALTTLNNIVFVEASQAMAKRVLTETEFKSDTDRMTRAIRLCVARPPTTKELSAFRELLTASRKWYAEHPQDATKLVGSYQPISIKSAEAAAWVATCRIIMNMDEFLTRE